jgi:hypothetical protein
MNKQKWFILAATLAMIGSTAGLLTELHAKQRLGAPGVKTIKLVGTQNLQVQLPEWVLDYRSKPVEVQKIVLDFLPPDTSYGQRLYTAADGFPILLNVVLMGADRTSIHRPEVCLQGQGWRVEQGVSSEAKIHIERPAAYDLPVVKLLATRTRPGSDQAVRGIYVYWFVAENALTAKPWQRMWWMAKGLLRSGVLQRWAYVSYFAQCHPGQEDAAFERMKKFIAASVPEFQLTTGVAKR